MSPVYTRRTMRSDVAKEHGTATRRRDCTVSLLEVPRTNFGHKSSKCSLPSCKNLPTHAWYLVASTSHYPTPQTDFKHQPSAQNVSSSSICRSRPSVCLRSLKLEL